MRLLAAAPRCAAGCAQLGCAACALLRDACLCRRLSPICLDVATLQAGIRAGEEAVMQALHHLLPEPQPADGYTGACVEMNGMEGMAAYARALSRPAGS